MCFADYLRRSGDVIWFGPQPKSALILHERCTMRIYLLCFVALWCLAQNVSAAADTTESDLSETARLLAILLDSGRVAIAIKPSSMIHQTRKQRLRRNSSLRKPQSFFKNVPDTIWMMCSTRMCRPSRHDYWTV